MKDVSPVIGGVIITSGTTAPEATKLAAGIRNRPLVLPFETQRFPRRSKAMPYGASKEALVRETTGAGLPLG